MSIVSAVVTFVIVWWLIFFMALPIGVRPQSDPVPGSDLGAPERPNLRIKVAATTVLAIALTALIAWVIDQGFISLRPGNS